MDGTMSTWTAEQVQARAFSVARRRNTLLLGPQGAGKMQVAKMMLKDASERIQASLSISCGQPTGQTWSIFLSPRVDGVSQASERFAAAGLSVAALESGDDPVCLLSFYGRMRSFQVLAMTPSAFLSMLCPETESGHMLSLDEVELLIFAEADLACRSEHPYCSIMDLVSRKVLGKRNTCTTTSSSCRLPRILGLSSVSMVESSATASVLRCTVHQMDISFVSLWSESDCMVPYDPHAPSQHLEHQVLSVMWEAWLELGGSPDSESSVRYFDKTFAQAPMYALGHAGLWCCLHNFARLLMAEIHKVQEGSGAEAAQSILDLTYTILWDNVPYMDEDQPNCFPIMVPLTALRGTAWMGDILGRTLPQAEPASFALPPRVRTLAVLLLSCHRRWTEQATGGHFRAMVYVERRCTVFSLGVLLASILQPHLIVGHTVHKNRKGAGNLALTMEDFRQGRIQVLLTTGTQSKVDHLPKCSIVVAVDPVHSAAELAFMRSRRLPSPDGFFFVMVGRAPGQGPNDEFLKVCHLLREAEPAAGPFPRLRLCFAGTQKVLDTNTSCFLLRRAMFLIKPGFRLSYRLAEFDSACSPSLFHVEVDLPPAVHFPGVHVQADRERDRFGSYPVCLNETEGRAVAAFYACTFLYGLLGDKLVAHWTAMDPILPAPGREPPLEENTSSVLLLPHTAEALGLTPVERPIAGGPLRRAAETVTGTAIRGALLLHGERDGRDSTLSLMAAELVANVISVACTNLAQTPSEVLLLYQLRSTKVYSPATLGCLSKCSRNAKCCGENLPLALVTRSPIRLPHSSLCGLGLRPSCDVIVSPHELELLICWHREAMAVLFAERCPNSRAFRACCNDMKDASIVDKGYICVPLHHNLAHGHPSVDWSTVRQFIFPSSIPAPIPEREQVVWCQISKSKRRVYFVQEPVRLTLGEYLDTVSRRRLEQQPAAIPWNCITKTPHTLGDGSVPLSLGFWYTAEDRHQSKKSRRLYLAEPVSRCPDVLVRHAELQSSDLATNDVLGQDKNISPMPVKQRGDDGSSLRKLRRGTPVLLIPELDSALHLPKQVVLALMVAGPVALDLERELLLETLEEEILRPAFRHAGKTYLPSNRNMLKCALQRPTNERMETLGDAWLNYYISIVVFQMQPTLKTEGLMTSYRSNRVCNARLRMCAEQRMLHCFLPAHQGWSPSLLPAKEPVKLHWKHLSDVVEALIGAFLLMGGDTCAASLLEYLGLPTIEWTQIKNAEREEQKGSCQISGTVELERSSPITDPARPWVTHYDSVLSRLPAAGLGAESWPAEVGAPVCLIELSQLADQGAICPEFLSKWPSSHLMNVVHKVESCLGYKFRCPWLCLQALTHETCCNEDWDCDDGLTHLPAHSYQRLEFLGDAVLCSVVTTMLYVLDCRLTPADLTVRKSYCICNSTLASVALEKLSLHRCLRASSHVLEYVETAIQRDRTQGNGSGSYLPKTLADGFEALAAAVYLDRNASIAAVRHVFWPLLKEYAEDGSRALGRSCQTSRAACGHVNEVFVGGGGNHGASSPSP